MRRRGLIAAVIVLALLLGLGLAGVLWVRPMLAYDAIEEGSNSSVGDRGRRIDAGPFGDYVSKRYVGGGRTTAEVSIANTGDRDVEVVQLGDMSERVDVALEEVRVGTVTRNTRNGGPPSRYLAFEPFELAAGEQRGVQMRFRMGSCGSLEPGTTVTVEGLLVRYRTGFAERGEFIDLSSPIEFRRTKDCGPAGRAQGSG